MYQSSIILTNITTGSPWPVFTQQYILCDMPCHTIALHNGKKGRIQAVINLYAGITPRNLIFN